MKLVTRQVISNGVKERWLKQYPLSLYKGSPKAAVYEKLVALGDNPKASDIDEIIGNRSWTRLNCCYCQKEVDSVVDFDVYDNNLRLCLSCISSAHSILV